MANKEKIDVEKEESRNSIDQWCKLRPECSRKELFRMLRAANHGFEPCWIISLRECLEQFESAMHEVHEFRNYLEDVRRDQASRSVNAQDQKRNFGDRT